MSKLFAAICCVLLLIATIASTAFAARVEGRITTNEVLKDLADLNPSTRITLNGGQFSTLVRKNGKFVIDHVPKGSYLLEIESIEYVYPKVRLDIRDKSIRSTYTITGNDWQTLGYQLAYPLNITARAPAEYFMKREGFNVAALFTNPMFLVMGISAVMLLVMPKMMESVKEMQKYEELEPKN